MPEPLKPDADTPAPRRVAVVTSHLTTGDAVSNDVVGMWGAFVGRGFDARIYAGSSDPTEAEVHDFSEIRQYLTAPTDLLIYHYSIDWDLGRELVSDPFCRLGIKYHNVTPPEFFAGVSPWHEEKCRAGREGLKELTAAARCDIYLADSDYNREDLLLEGAPPERCFVVPPFHHVDRLRALDADLDVLDEYRDGAANLLMVGRVSPNKGHAALIEAFAAYHHDYNPKSRLLIVGKEEKAFKVYSKRLREHAKFLQVEDAVHFIGGATDSELKAYYLLSSVFAIASEHEGFCVPVVEAMSMKVPVVAYASSALTATVGGGGLLLRERDPYLMAEAIDWLVSNEELNAAAGWTGWRRYERHFSNGRVEEALFAALEGGGVVRGR